MRRLTGYLLAPDNSALASTTIVLEAVASSPGGVPQGASAQITTDAQGAYDVQVLPGRYRVSLPGPPQRHVLGTVTILDGPDTDLLSALGAEVSESVMQTLLNDVLTAQAATEAARDAAATSETNAANSADQAAASAAAAASPEIGTEPMQARRAALLGSAAFVDWEQFEAYLKAKYGLTEV